MVGVYLRNVLVQTTNWKYVFGVAYIQNIALRTFLFLIDLFKTQQFNNFKMTQEGQLNKYFE